MSENILEDEETINLIEKSFNILGALNIKDTSVIPIQISSVHMDIMHQSQKSGNESTNKKKVIKDNSIQHSKYLNIFDDIDIPDNIRIEAKKIFQSMKNEYRRIWNKNQIVIYCIFKASGNIGRLYDPSYLCTLLNIDKTQVTETLTKLKNTGQGKDFYSPVDFIPHFVDILDIKEAREDLVNILKFSEETIKLDDIRKNLDGKRPETISIGIVLYYLESIHGIEIDMKTILSKINKSEVTINDVLNRIRAVLEN